MTRTVWPAVKWTEFFSTASAEPWSSEFRESTSPLSLSERTVGGHLVADQPEAARGANSAPVAALYLTVAAGNVQQALGQGHAVLASEAPTSEQNGWRPA